MISLQIFLSKEDLTWTNPPIKILYPSFAKQSSPSFTPQPLAIYFKIMFQIIYPYYALL